MPSPFPGMDPYLEDSEIWPGFHNLLASELAAQLTPQIGPKYYADIDVRSVTEEISLATTHTIYPDVGVLEQMQPETESQPHSIASAVAIPQAPLHRVVMMPSQTKLRAVQIYMTERAQLITSIEILSPVNKRQGEGLKLYRRKRLRLLQSMVHLIEIDLLRGGQRPGREVAEPPLDTDYVLLVNRSREDDVRISEIWPVALNEPLPLLPVPLSPPDPDVVMNLAKALQTIYTRMRYDWRIDYNRPVPPPLLRSAMATWLSEHLPRNRS